MNPDVAPVGEARRPGRPLPLTEGGPTQTGPVAVAGAGPAGLECALELARAGRAVTIFEASERIGGQLATAAAAPNRHGWRRLFDFYQARLDSDPVELRLGEPLSASSFADFAELIVAAGAMERKPDIAGTGAARTVSEVLDDGVPPLPEGGGGDLGRWLRRVAGHQRSRAGRGGKSRRVTFLTPTGGFAAGIPAESRIQLMPRLGGTAVETRSFLAPLAIEPGLLRVRHRFTGEEETIAADQVVVVGERVPRPLDLDLPAGLSARAIGDCVRRPPRSRPGAQRGSCGCCPRLSNAARN